MPLIHLLLRMSAAILLLVAVSKSQSFATQLIAYDQSLTANTGTLYNATDVSGAVNPRNTVGGLVGIDFSSAGILYGLGQGDNPFLYSIDPITGTATSIGTGIGLNGIFEGAIAFDPITGTLYGLYQLATPDLNLFTVDITTGQATVVGGFNADFRNPAAMAFDNAGNLWVLNTQSGTNSLLKIDPATGAVLAEYNLIESGNEYNGLSGAAGMDFDPTTNTMYVATTLLWTLDVSGDAGTGTLTALLGGFSFLPKVTGLAVVPDGLVTVPEPASMLLLGLGLILVGIGSARKAIGAKKP